MQELEKQNLELQLQIHELKARLSKNSSNSGKPPSSDGLKRKPKSLRGKSDRKCGGQKGHVGKGLAQTSAPDEVVTHTPSNCSGCGLDLSNARVHLSKNVKLSIFLNPRSM